MVVYNAVMILMIVALGIYNYLMQRWHANVKAFTYGLAFYFAIMLVNTLILAWSVIAIRKMLKSLKNAFSNDKFIGIHVINSCIYSLIVFLPTISLMILVETDEKNEDRN